MLHAATASILIYEAAHGWKSRFPSLPPGPLPLGACFFPRCEWRQPPPWPPPSGPSAPEILQNTFLTWFPSTKDHHDHHADQDENDRVLDHGLPFLTPE